MPASVLFCTKCGSGLVDVFGWKKPGTATFQCCKCGNEDEIRGFTCGRVFEEEGLSEDLVQRARKDAPMGPREGQMTGRDRISDVFGFNERDEED